MHYSCENNLSFGVLNAIEHTLSQYERTIETCTFYITALLHHSSTIQIGKYNSQTTVINISGLRDETSAEDRYEGMGRLTQPKEAWSLHKKISIPSSMGNLVAFALNHSNGGTQTRIVTTKSVIQMALYDNFGSFYSNCLQTKYNQIELNKG